YGSIWNFVALASSVVQRHHWPRRRVAAGSASHHEGTHSNHEEPMGGVAPELFDEAIFPVEIGLHGLGCDIGAFIGTPVTMRRIELWQIERRSRFQHAIIAAIEHVSLPAHLREPGRRHVGTDR